MKKLFIMIIIFCGAFLSETSFSAEIDGIRVFVNIDRRNFYSGEDVRLHVLIRNISRDNISFNVYDGSGREDIYRISRGDNVDFTTFRPVVYDMEGRNAEVIVPYVVRSEKLADQLKWMNKRVIVLGPGETFSHTQSLNRIYRLEPEKEYRVKLNFFPYLGEEKEGIVLSSNEVVFVHKFQKRYLEESVKPKESYGLVPSEIVVLLLNSELDGNWKRALKYVDIEKFIRSYPAFSKEYEVGDDYDKRRIKMDFMRFLATNRKDSLIKFRVTGEEIDPSGTSAIVEVEALRKSVVSPDMFKYRYRLERKNISDPLWNVSGVEASVMKGVVND